MLGGPWGAGGSLGVWGLQGPQPMWPLVPMWVQVLGCPIPVGQGALGGSLGGGIRGGCRHTTGAAACAGGHKYLWSSQADAGSICARRRLLGEVGARRPTATPPRCQHGHGPHPNPTGGWGHPGQGGEGALDPPGPARGRGGRHKERGVVGVVGVPSHRRGGVGCTAGGCHHPGGPRRAGAMEAALRPPPQPLSRVLGAGSGGCALCTHPGCTPTAPLPPVPPPGSTPCSVWVLQSVGG